MKQCEAIQVDSIESSGLDAPSEEGADLNQGWTSSLYECADGRDAQRSDGCIGGEQRGSQCVLETNVMTCLDTGQVELDFMSWLDVNKKDVKQPEYRSRMCGKEIKRWDSTTLGAISE